MGINLNKMKAPSQPRPTWRNGIIQIHVTRACDLSCNSCTQGSNLAGKIHFITPDQFREALRSVKDYFGVIGIFGGNPCVHPKFEELCQILQAEIPWEQRGLWSNNLRQHGELCREIFNPRVSNLNVHGNLEVFKKMKQDWPESLPFGLEPSRHSPPFVALGEMEDLGQTKREILIENCDINQYWSALVGTFRGELRAWFCEIAGSQSMLNQEDPNYPDTGIKVFPGWWRLKMSSFEDQVYKHCYDCGVPLKLKGSLDFENIDYYSKTHEHLMKSKNGKTQFFEVRRRSDFELVPKSTDYILNGINK